MYRIFGRKVVFTLEVLKGSVGYMEYIAHKDGERIQTVKEHLYGTAELAGFFAERFGKKVSK